MGHILCNTIIKRGANKEVAKMLFGLMVVAFIMAHPIMTILGFGAMGVLMNFGDIYREFKS